MKRVILRPGKSVTVSDDAMTLARQALSAVGVTQSQAREVIGYTGDVTIGSSKPSTVRAVSGKVLLRSSSVSYHLRETRENGNLAGKKASARLAKR